jgi:hypothetical protein
MLSGCELAMPSASKPASSGRQKSVGSSSGSVPAAMEQPQGGIRQGSVRHVATLPAAGEDLSAAVAAVAVEETCHHSDRAAQGRPMLSG